MRTQEEQPPLITRRLAPATKDTTRGWFYFIKLTEPLFEYRDPAFWGIALPHRRGGGLKLTLAKPPVEKLKKTKALFVPRGFIQYEASPLQGNRPGGLPRTPLNTDV